MTTYAFTPSSTTVQSFSPTLDGNTYNVFVPYNLYGQDYSVSIYDQAGNLVVTKTLVASPDDYDINLLWGYFKTSTMVFRASTQSFEVLP